ncbi:MAG: MBL fold metallo-hydrolase [Promethearchaeota archaeon]
MFFSRNTSRRGKKVISDLYYFPETPMLDCNQYIIKNNKTDELALFDAGNGISLDALFKGMRALNLNPDDITKVFITHEHVDHVLGLYPLMKLRMNDPPQIFAYGETVQVLSEGNESKIFPGNLGISPSMFGLEIIPLKVKDLKGIDQITVFDDFNFQIYYTPGHSSGSICYYEPNKKILIPGDLVFAGGSFGRYDFPGGSLKKLQKSIKFVTTLDVKYLLPGHMNISENGNQQIALSYRMATSLGNYF